jgi:tetratricopeptide (TPR) repeat protein
MKIRVTLSMIVRNEENVLATSLVSIARLADEIIIVDTGSTDRTAETGLAHSARVVPFRWCDDFSAARNESLRHASGDWIFWLDADEFLDEPNREKLRILLSTLRLEPAAYTMTQRSPGADGMSAVCVPQIRLFRRDPAIRWEYRVHEQLLPSVRRAGHKVRGTDIVISHAGYQDPALYAAKLERNLRLLLLDQADRRDDPFTLFNLGLAYGGQGRHADAIEVLRRSLKCSQPGDSFLPKLFAALVREHEQLGQKAEAFTASCIGLGQFPDHAELLFLDGRLRRAQGDAAGAESSWRKVYSLSPLGPTTYTDWDEAVVVEARHQLALLCREQGRLVEAEALWRQAIDGQPGLTSAWLGLGDLFLTQRRWNELEDAWVHLSRSPAGALDGAVLRARACLARQELPAARALLEDVIANAPKAVAPQLLLTQVLLQDGSDPGAAERSLRAVLDLDPSLVEARRNQAVLLRNQNRLAEAIAVCDAASANGAEDTELLLLHGLLLRDAGDPGKAETCLTRVVEKEDRNRERRVTARHNLALICRHQGRLAEAESHWRAVLAEFPELPAAWIGLAELRLMQNRLTELDDILARLDVMSHDAQAVGLLRARLHLARRAFAAAKQILEQLVDKSPHAVEPRRLLSYALLQEGSNEEAAEQSLRELLRLVPDDAEARHNLAVLHRKQGRAG